MHFVRFKVKGNFQFPIDMLRHDQCYPLTPTDSATISNSYLARNPEGFEVELGTYTSHRWANVPNVERWASFGWFVDPDSVETES